MIRKRFTAFLAMMLVLIHCSFPDTVTAEEDKDQEKMALYKKTEAVTTIPWYYLAAIDQFENNIQEDSQTEGDVSIDIPRAKWFGAGNPSQLQLESWISMFNGWGKDGDDDGLADPSNDEDVLYTMANWIAHFGTSKEDIKIALWKYYQRDLSVQTVMNIAKTFKKFNTITLESRDFPVPTTSNYSYKNTWGDSRGFGGKRIHEGTDIFANYGVPVKATTYGVVEMKGWNMYGGWRIGIRDINNTYHYYGHLNGYEDGIKVGQVVQPGDVIGSVGATGYGPPGTSGKFPPHLHYGMYKDNGHTEWSFDPYPYLKKWEKEAKQNN